jgi:hypothetical protein
VHNITLEHDKYFRMYCLTCVGLQVLIVGCLYGLRPTLYCWPPLPLYINKGRRESFHSHMFIHSLVFTLVMRCDLEKSVH